MNRNWLEEVDVPIGEDDAFTPCGPTSSSRPTSSPGRNRVVFTIRVPPDWGDRGTRVDPHQPRGDRAGLTRPCGRDYIVDNTVVISETGALGAGSSSPEMRADQPLAINLEGLDVRETSVGQRLPSLCSSRTTACAGSSTAARAAFAASSMLRTAPRGAAYLC